MRCFVRRQAVKYEMKSEIEIGLELVWFVSFFVFVSGGNPRCCFL
jgi:hypothetical protein